MAYDYILRALSKCVADTATSAAAHARISKNISHMYGIEATKKLEMLFRRIMLKAHNNSNSEIDVVRPDAARIASQTYHIVMLV
mmetsp:Transcript_2297/g.3030  ORF Transcript_2297/g.3030 Transcript_2297/m.3030 type:complete len:84 (+) Transcript_2297:586-837(+)